MTDSANRRQRRRFSDEFKREAVELLRHSGASTSQVNADLVISPSLLSRRSREIWSARTSACNARTSF